MRSLSQETTRTTPQHSLTMNPTRKGALGEGKSDGSACKGYSPDGGAGAQSNASELLEFAMGINHSCESGDGVPGRVSATRNSSSNTSGGGSGKQAQQSHRSGSSIGSPDVGLGGVGHVSGFAVVDQSCFGSDELGVMRGEMNLSNDSVNTYGPLTEAVKGSSVADNNGDNNDRAKSSTLFTTVQMTTNVSDMQDSPRMAEDMFARRVNEARRENAQPADEQPADEKPAAESRAPQATIEFFGAPVVTCLSPAGPASNAFPMSSSDRDSYPSDVHMDDGESSQEDQHMLGGHVRTSTGTSIATMEPVPVSTYSRRHLMQTEPAAELLRSESAGSLQQSSMTTRLDAVTPGLEDYPDDGRLVLNRTRTQTAGTQ